jgi:hypothetical protein
MRFRYLVCLYGLYSHQCHIAVPDKAEKKLRGMADDLVGSDDLVAIYIPEGTAEVYQPGNGRGRVVGGVQLLPMPEDRGIRDYFFRDWDESLRWPIGWPCRVIYSPPVDKCPVLRSMVDTIYGPNNLKSYVGQLRDGPLKLSHEFGDRLDAWFARISNE